MPEKIISGQPPRVKYISPALRPALPVAAEAAVRFAGAFILSLGSVGGKYSPMAVGFVASAPPGIMSLVSLLGAVIGYFISDAPYIALKYSGMGILAAGAVFTFRETRIFRRTFFRPLAAGAMAACTGFVYVFDSGFAPNAFAAFLCETAAAAAGAWAFTEALSPYSPRSFGTGEVLRRSALLASFGMLFVSLAGVRIFGAASVGRCLAALFVLLSAVHGGVPGGAVCGAVIGAAADIASGASCFTAAFTLGGIFTALLRKQGKLASALTFAASGCLAMLVLWKTLRDSGVFYEIPAACLIFLLIPTAAASKITRFFPAESSCSGVLFERECERRRASDASDAFRALSSAVRERSALPHNDEDISSVFDAAAERVCRSCRKRDDCWQRGYQDTLRTFNDLTSALRENGEITASDFPLHFTSKCAETPRLAVTVTEEARAQRLRLRAKARAAEMGGAAAGQYSDVADVLADISERLGPAAVFEPEAEKRLASYLRSLGLDAQAAVFRARGGRLRAQIKVTPLKALLSDGDWLNKLSAVLGVRLCTSDEGSAPGCIELFEAEPLAAEAGTSSVRRKSEIRSGDRASCFKTASGHFFALLSDGAGSGAGAEKCSADALTLLEKLLCAEIAPDSALRLLNSILLSGGGADSAAIDLADINLFTGVCDLYKFGAPASYAVSGRCVRKLSARGIPTPAGTLPDANAEHFRLTLSPGARLVLASDGVTCGIDDGWLVSALEEADSLSAHDAAKRLSDLAVEKFGGDDDITVLTVCVSERK